MLPAMRRSRSRLRSRTSRPSLGFDARRELGFGDSVCAVLDAPLAAVEHQDDTGEAGKADRSDGRRVRAAPLRGPVRRRGGR